MSPTIRIDDDVFDELKKHAEPFVDTPNTVLRRLLNLGETGPAEMNVADDTSEELAQRNAPAVQRHGSASAT